MDPFELALLIGAVVAAIICRNDKRALAWIALGSLNFAITTTYARYASPAFPASVFAGICDGWTAILIIVCRRHLWERRLAVVFMAMLLVSFLRTVGLADRFAYVIALEVLNWVALLVVIHPRIMRLADEYMARTNWRGGLARSVHRGAARAYRERQIYRPPRPPASEEAR